MEFLKFKNGFFKYLIAQQTKREKEEKMYTQNQSNFHSLKEDYKYNHSDFLMSLGNCKLSEGYSLYTISTSISPVPQTISALSHSSCSSFFSNFDFSILAISSISTLSFFNFD